MKNNVRNEYGYCYYCVCDDCAMLYNLYVEKEHRRQGNATKLVKKAIDAIKADGYEGCIKIVAEPEEEDISREALITFYEKMNLKVI